MKKNAILIFCLLIVGVVVWFTFHNQGSDEGSASKTVRKQNPVVHNISEEPVTGNGTLGDAIHNTQIFLNGVLEQGQVKTIDFEKNKENLNTVIGYEQGAIKFANKVNASKEIKKELQKALDDTKTAIANQNYDSLYKVGQSLIKLDKSYNGNI
jgi:hypothetical protein